jgi:hypothetical protein
MQVALVLGVQSVAHNNCPRKCQSRQILLQPLSTPCMPFGSCFFLPTVGAVLCETACDTPLESSLFRPLTNHRLHVAQRNIHLPLL